VASFSTAKTLRACQPSIFIRTSTDLDAPESRVVGPVVVGVRAMVGPMTLQPIRDSPMVSSAGKTKGAQRPKQPQTQTLIKADAISAEKARTTPLNSLRKQREALKAMAETA